MHIYNFSSIIKPDFEKIDTWSNTKLFQQQKFMILETWQTQFYCNSHVLFL